MSAQLAKGYLSCGTSTRHGINKSFLLKTINP
jgi:hypothetical protein